MSVELGQRAIACKHWRWMPGMRVISNREGELEDVIQRVPDDMRGWRLYSEDAFPDLEDAATLGCLLQLVREARQEPWYYPTAQVYGGQVLWLVERPVRERQTLHESEAAVLVAALEAVP